MRFRAVETTSYHMGTIFELQFLDDTSWDDRNHEWKYVLDGNMVAIYRKTLKEMKDIVEKIKKGDYDISDEGVLIIKTVKYHEL